MAAYWGVPLGLLFIDGGHGVEPACLDYAGWTPHVAPGGRLVTTTCSPTRPTAAARPTRRSTSRPSCLGHFVEVTAVGLAPFLERTV